MIFLLLYQVKLRQVGLVINIKYYLIEKLLLHGRRPRSYDPSATSLESSHHLLSSGVARGNSGGLFVTDNFFYLSFS